MLLAKSDLQTQKPRIEREISTNLLTIVIATYYVPVFPAVEKQDKEKKISKRYTVIIY